MWDPRGTSLINYLQRAIKCKHLPRGTSLISLPKGISLRGIRIFKPLILGAGGLCGANLPQILLSNLLFEILKILWRLLTPPRSKDLIIKGEGALLKTTGRLIIFDDHLIVAKVTVNTRGRTLLFLPAGIVGDRIPPAREIVGPVDKFAGAVAVLGTIRLSVGRPLLGADAILGHIKIANILETALTISLQIMK